MTHAFTRFLTPLACAGALTLSLFSGGAAMAQTQRGAAATASTAHCDGVKQDRAACIREAGAARHEAQRGGLSSPAPSAAEANALARCQQQPAADRSACEDRMRGTGDTTTRGSVLGGGVIREAVTPIPAQPAQ